MTTSSSTRFLADIPLTKHAWRRLSQRGIGKEGLLAAFDHGRQILERGANILFVGRKEVARAKKRGVDISQHEGIHVVCSHDGMVITLYRNRHLDVRASGRSFHGKAA